MHLDLLNVTYRRGKTEILLDVNLRLEQGHHYCLIGPNGSGKTTLLSVISGIEWPTTGSAILSDKATNPTPHVRERFGHFFPRYAATLEAHHPEISALELITTGLHQTLGYYRPASSEDFARARELFNRHIHSIPPEAQFATLSTGERFRLLLLRCLINDPSVLILDEPFDGLDLPGRYDFEGLIAQAAVDTKGISLTVLHRIEEIPEFVTDIILLKQGRVMAQGPKASVLTGENLTALYGMKLICREHAGRYYVLHGD